jgi:hypothetical protein
VMAICRRDFPPWMTAKKDYAVPSEAYADLKAAMEKDFQ